MKKTNLCLRVIFTAVLLLTAYAHAALAEPQIRRDFDIGNPQKLLGEAREKFMAFPEKSVVEDYKHIFERDEKDFYTSAFRSAHGDVVIFIAHQKDNENTEYAYDSIVYTYPDLELVSIGAALLEESEAWDNFYEEIVYGLDPDADF
jgi:hypothetical protein